MREYELNLYVDKLTWMAVKDYMKWVCGIDGITGRDVLYFCEANDLDYAEIANLGNMAMKYTYEYEV